MNLQLPSEHQRLFVLIGVGVIALAGLFLVTRVVGGESSGTSSPPAKSSPAKPGGAKNSSKDGSTAKSSPSKSAPKQGDSTAVKPSRKAYVNCVQQAADTAALEKCQALVP